MTSCERKSPPSGLAEDGQVVRTNEDRAAACLPVDGKSKWASGPRAECLRLLEDLIGPEGVPQWLQGTQPAFDGRTGGQMLQSDPARLLRHLEALHVSLGDDDLDDLPIIVDRPPARRRESEAAKVLSILDELFPEGGA